MDERLHFDKDKTQELHMSEASVQSKPSRRDFLSTSAATTTALAASLSLTRSIHAAGAERFNVALIGAGNRVARGRTSTGWRSSPAKTAIGGSRFWSS